jgi:hypothetical protein
MFTGLQLFKLIENKIMSEIPLIKGLRQEADEKRRMLRTNDFPTTNNRSKHFFGAYLNYVYNFFLRLRNVHDKRRLQEVDRTVESKKLRHRKHFETSDTYNASKSKHRKNRKIGNVSDPDLLALSAQFESKALQQLNILKS